jgi:hypothetical protein
MKHLPKCEPIPFSRAINDEPFIKESRFSLSIIEINIVCLFKMTGSAFSKGIAGRSSVRWSVLDQGGPYNVQSSDSQDG